MRARNFYLSLSTYTGSGNLTSFGGTNSDPEIRSGDVVFQNVCPQQDSDDDPYGNINMSVLSRSVNDGSITTQISKSAASPGTTDSIDNITLSARG